MRCGTCAVASTLSLRAMGLTDSHLICPYQALALFHHHLRKFSQSSVRPSSGGPPELFHVAPSIQPHHRKAICRPCRAPSGAVSDWPPARLCQRHPSSPCSWLRLTCPCSAPSPGRHSPQTHPLSPALQ